MFPDLMRDDVFRLETRRLWLRWPRMADAQAVVRLAGNKNVAQMTERLPHPYPRQAADQWIFESRVGNAQGSAIVLALTLKAKPGDLIGAIGIHETRPRHAVLGYWLGEPFWGRGLMGEAAATLIDLVFHTSEIERIATQVRVDNPASRRILVANGFAREGSGPVDLAQRGGVFECERFALDRNAWAARSTGQAAASAPDEWRAA